MNPLGFLKMAFALATEVAEAAEAEQSAPKGPVQSIKRWSLTVPAGHTLRCGTPVTQPFALVVEAGTRWHPDWDAPRITVNAYRVFPMGDALCWSGNDALAFEPLLPPEALALVPHHGVALSDESRELLATLGLTEPSAKQDFAAFNTFRNTVN